ncbi:unnamed protein product [Symbiodinium sp. KB8]|nr:unnamed protein product [Symbiodinium sp. KB8]
MHTCKLPHRRRLGAKQADLITYNVAISACEKAAEWEPALSLLSKLGDASLIRDVVTYGASISACEKATRWPEALLLLGEAEATVQANVIILSAAISACEKALPLPPGSQWRSALDLLGQAGPRRLRADTIMYSSAVSACGRAFEWQQALRLLGEVEMEQFAPEIVVYNSAITACEKTEKWEAALQLMSYMEEKGLQADVITYSSAVSACDKAGRWELATWFLSLGRIRHLQPNAFTYSAAISACAKQAKWRTALALCQESRENELPPSEILWGSVISSLEKGGKWQHALLFLEEGNSYALSLDAVAYSSAIRACAGAHRWQQAVELILEVEFRDPNSMAVPLSCAIAACQNSLASQAGLQMLGKLEPTDIEDPDVVEGKRYTDQVRLSKRFENVPLKDLLPASIEARAARTTSEFKAAGFEDSATFVEDPGTSRHQRSADSPKGAETPPARAAKVEAPSRFGYQHHRCESSSCCCRLVRCPLSLPFSQPVIISGIIMIFLFISNSGNTSNFNSKSTIIDIAITIIIIIIIITTISIVITSKVLGPARTAWGLGKLETRREATMAVVAEEALTKLRQANSQDKPLSSRFLREVSMAATSLAVQREVDSFRVQDHDDRARARENHVYSEAAMRVVAGRLVEISEQFDAQASSNAAWCFAKVQLLGTASFGVIGGLALRAQAASNIAWAATQASSDPPELMDALKDLTLRATKEALPGELARAAHAKLAGSRAPELAGGVGTYALGQMEDFTEPHLPWNAHHIVLVV